MKALNDWVFVTIEKEKVDTLRHGSLELLVDPDYNPTDRNQKIGVVAAAPAKYSQYIRTGDIVHMHYNAIQPVHSEEVDGQKYYWVDYHMILCVEREGKILPTGFWTVCEPIMKPDFDEVEVDGIKVNVKQTGSSTGLVVITNEERHDTLFARVVASDQHPVGATVAYEPDSDFDNRGGLINEHRYFFVRNEDITAYAKE